MNKEILTLAKKFEISSTISLILQQAGQKYKSILHHWWTFLNAKFSARDVWDVARHTKLRNIPCWSPSK